MLCGLWTLARTRLFGRPRCYQDTTTTTSILPGQGIVTYTRVRCGRSLSLSLSLSRGGGSFLARAMCFGINRRNAAQCAGMCVWFREMWADASMV